MKWVRFIVGPQPALRLIALLLAIIIVLLFLVWREEQRVRRDIPAPCGDTYNPCEVKIDTAANNGF